MFEIKFNATAFLKAVAAARERFARAVVEAVRAAGKKTVEQAKAAFDTPNGPKNRTNRLLNSIQDTEIDAHTVRVEATARHAAWVERGNGFRTGAQFIRPKRAPFLVFYLDGNKIVTRQVKTSKPKPYMAEGRKHGEPLFLRLCEDAAKNMFE